ncbi:MAG: diguanylate cyclase [Anaerolineaceae bacterium]|nr:MAG: diguanylate cyclase [Anaerolineaceae bacterium]
MKKNKQWIKWFLAINVTALIILVVIMILKVTNLQGDARVINYAGRARGATQRLVKQELSGFQNDDLILTLDAILNELFTGIGNNNLSLLKDKFYQSKLKEQIEAWEDLKEKIYTTRDKPDNAGELFILSEKYYDISDDTVDAAETYSANSALFLKNLEYIIVIVSIIIFVTIILLSYNLLHLARLNKKLNEVAYIDTLTGLPSRSQCEIKMAEGGIIEKDLEVSCLMFDLNNLKTTNDELGHAAGDSLLINFANILRSSAPERMFIGRFGGDEFIGIIKDTSEKEIQLFIKTLENNIEKYNENNIIIISYAYGYAMSSSYKEITIKGLLAQADKEMYKRKAQMKNYIA